MEQKNAQLDDATIDALLEFLGEDVVEEIEKEIFELAINEDSIYKSEKLSRVLIKYLDQALRIKNGKSVNYGQGSIGLLERTIFNKYLDIGKKQSKQDIPLDLIPLFLYAARYYRVNGDLDKARKIFAKIREANIYKNDIDSSIMLDEEEAACELEDVSVADMPTMKVKKETTMQDLIEFLEKNNIKILDSNQEIFAREDRESRVIKRRDGPSIKRQYPEKLNAISRLKFICDNYEIERVSIVEEGGFKGAAILQIKGTGISIVENLLENDEKESYGRATYIVPNDLIGANKIKDSSRRKFKSEHDGKVEKTNHGKNYYEKLTTKVNRLIAARGNDDIGSGGNSLDDEDDRSDDGDGGSGTAKPSQQGPSGAPTGATTDTGIGNDIKEEVFDFVAKYKKLLEELAEVEAEATRLDAQLAEKEQTHAKLQQKTVQAKEEEEKARKATEEALAKEAKSGEELEEMRTEKEEIESKKKDLEEKKAQIASILGGDGR